MGFVDAKDKAFQPRIILSLEGLEKTGKTHFSLTAPGPIALFSTDIGEEGVVSKFKNVWVMSIDKISDDSAGQAPAEFNRFKEAYMDIIHGKSVRTIVIDTATEIWEILRMARFGRISNVLPLMYGPVNAEYRALIREAYSCDKNLILIHRMKPIYKEKTKTDEYERAGFGDTGSLVQVNALIYRRNNGDFAISIINCRQNPYLIGEELDGPMCNFPFLASMVLPDVDSSWW